MRSLFGTQLSLWPDWAGKDGSFKRQTSGFRDVVSPASDKNAKYPAEKGRYVLYVSYACPWSVGGDRLADQPLTSLGPTAL